VIGVAGASALVGGELVAGGSLVGCRWLIRRIFPSLDGRVGKSDSVNDTSTE